MDCTGYFLRLAVLFSFCVFASQGQDDYHGGKLPLIMKEINLHEITPQGILHLPPRFSVKNDNHSCHYWISFLKDVPEYHWIDHKDFGISIVPIDFELASGDSIDLLGHPVVNATKDDFIRETWNSSLNQAYTHVELKTVFQNVCINFTGEWDRSKSNAKLAITLFYDNNEQLSTYCPDGMVTCNCKQNQLGDSISSGKRCISQDLLCNGVKNCGTGCEYDEVATCAAHDEDGGGSDDKHQTKEACLWTNFEYLLMMFMTGLLLILIPAVFLLTMMYHRRLNQQRGSLTPAAFDGNNNFHGNNGRSHDTPPTYDNLPDDVKVLPRRE